MHSTDQDAAIRAAAAAYFTGRRARVDSFVRDTFGLRGTFRLHRAALGWDLLRAPVNVFLSPVLVLTRLAAAGLDRAGAKRAARWLGSRRILLETDTAREVQALVVTRLLELPWPAGPHRSSRDALAEALLAHPDLSTQVPAAAGQVAQSLGEYGGSRAAVGELTTALGTLGAGALAFQAVTPGMVSIAPALAATLAHSAAISAFPLGAGAGALWYGVFPTEVPFALSAAALVGLMMLGAVLAAFAGLIADPVQVWTGIHRRRLLRLIDALEATFTGDGQAGFSAREHYFARVLDLADAGISALRMLRG
jgi:hypothetical protein